MMRKRNLILTAAAVMTIASASTALAGWQQGGDGRYWYTYEDGSYARNGIKTIDGYEYAFDNDGYMQIGWQYINFKWYYFEPSTVAKVYGWREIGGKWYYLDPEDFGSMYTYWLNIGDNRYYLDENGVMQTGIFFLSDPTSGSSFAYQADPVTGALYRNRKLESSDGQKTFRYDDNGIMQYSSPATRRVAKITGDDEWQYVLNEQKQKEQDAENDQIIRDGVNELKNELYEDYRDDVRSKSGTGRQNAQKRWEDKATRQLKDLVDSGELTEYINQVEGGRYIRASVSTDYFEDEDED